VKIATEVDDLVSTHNQVLLASAKDAVSGAHVLLVWLR
jgi:hypothetical protein